MFGSTVGDVNVELVIEEAEVTADSAAGRELPPKLVIAEAVAIELTDAGDATGVFGATVARILVGVPWTLVISMYEPEDVLFDSGKAVAEDSDARLVVGTTAPGAEEYE